MDCYLIPKSCVKIIEPCARKTICNFVSTMLARAHFTYIIIDPIQSVFFFAPCERGGLAFEALLYNFKTSNDTATKITQNKKISNV